MHMITPPGADKWAGQTVACIAPGPSLKREDCDAIQAAGLRTIAVNRAWEWAPFCDVIYSADRAWWVRHAMDINVPAECWTRDSEAAMTFRINRMPSTIVENSGLRAMDLARHFGARRILLLGYDCQLTNGKTHFHGDHNNGLSNPNRERCKRWRIQFTRFAKSYKKLEVVNCSRATGLECFPRMPLEEALTLAQRPTDRPIQPAAAMSALA